MRAPPLRLILSPAAALPGFLVALDVADARRHEPPARHVGAVNPQANLQAHPPPAAPIHPGSVGENEPLRIPDAALEPAGWGDLDGWSGDDHASAFATFQASCRPIVRTKSVTDIRPVRAALQAVCARAVTAGPLDKAAARNFFEANFLPIW